jgi:hypothetical protein
VASHSQLSSDSRSLLFEAGDGALWLAQLGTQPQRAAERVAARVAPCGAACTGSTYAFQP